MARLDMNDFVTQHAGKFIRKRIPQADNAQRVFRVRDAVVDAFDQAANLYTDATLRSA